MAGMKSGIEISAIAASRKRRIVPIANPIIVPADI